MLKNDSYVQYFLTFGFSVIDIQLMKYEYYVNQEGLPNFRSIGFVTQLC